MRVGIDNGQVQGEESPFISIFSPFYTLLHMCTYVCKLCCMCVKSSHIQFTFYKLGQRPRRSNFLPVLYLIPLLFILLPHVQSIKDAVLTSLAHKLSCIDFLKDARLQWLVNVPLKDLFCSNIISETRRIYTHLIVQMP